MVVVAEVQLGAAGLDRADLAHVGLDRIRFVEVGSEVAAQKEVEEAGFEADLEERLEAVDLGWKAAVHLMVAVH